MTFSTICPSACLSLCLCFCLGFRIIFRSCLLQFTPTFDPRWQRDTQLATNQFQSASAHMTHCQHETELSLSFTRPNNASWGYHSVSAPVGLGEVLHVRSSTINRVTFSTICPSARLSFCYSVLQSTPTFTQDGRETRNSPQISFSLPQLT